MRNRSVKSHDESLQSEDQMPPLSAAWRREIERRIKDSDDPRRYIVKSVLLPGRPKPWELYYDITDDVWAMDFGGATLFKRRKAAKLIADMLGDRCSVEEVKVGKSGKISRTRKRARPPERTRSRKKP